MVSNIEFEGIEIAHEDNPNSYGVINPFLNQWLVGVAGDVDNVSFDRILSSRCVHSEQGNHLLPHRRP
jgi:hypothetical protein